MKKIVLEDNKLYHIKEIMDNFPSYFGMTFEEVEAMFMSPSLIEKEEIREYLCKHQKLLWENRFSIQVMKDIEPIIEERIKDYDMFKIQLAILGNKGRNYLWLLKYILVVKDIFQEDSFYEQIFRRLHILHFNGYMSGEHLTCLLIPIQYIIQDMQKILKKINTMSTYHRQTYDSFARTIGQEKVYPEDCLVSSNCYTGDKTTFCLSRCKIKKK